MLTIKYIAFDGSTTEIEADVGQSVMQAAINNGVPGIVAECAGACACATCHVYFDEEWFVKLPEPQNAEKQMLEYAIDPKENSRLGCQIKLTDELDGLVVHTPESQI